MSRNLSLEDIQLIAGLINDKHDDLKDHLNTQVRTLQQVNEENHNNLYSKIEKVEVISEETRVQATQTNGRVNKIEDTLYGEIDTNGNIVPGHEGFIYKFQEIKDKNKWLIWNWKYKVALALIVTALFIQESREVILSFFNIKL